MKSKRHCRCAAIIVCGLLASIFFERRACAVPFQAAHDNTLLRYDPTDANTALNSNGSGDFFSAGRTASRDEIRRGLIRFDLSTVPDNMQVVPGTVRLQLRVVGIPRRDTNPRPFWFVGLSGLGEPWGEGASVANIAVSGAGSGAPSQLGDATWFHTSYDPNIHNATDFISGGTGFWTLQGALGPAILDPGSIYGAAAGMTASTEGFVDFTSLSMESDINMWLANPASNFGWIMIGDEGVTGGGDASSKRDFASREHDNPSFHPLLTFEVRAVPEPSAAFSGVIGIIAAALIGRLWGRLSSLPHAKLGRPESLPHLE